MEEVHTRRSTADLIRELEEVAPHFSFIWLVVDFDKHTEFVFADDEQRLKKLNSLVESGGEPVGLVGFNRERDHLNGYSRPLDEFKNAAWVREFLVRLMELTYERIAALRIVKSGARFKRKKGWEN